MSNGYWTRIHPRDTGVWSWPQSTVHCFALPHCSANQISSECFLDITAENGYRMFLGPSGLAHPLPWALVGRRWAGGGGGFRLLETLFFLLDPRPLQEEH